MELVLRTEADVGDYVQIWHKPYQVIGFEVVNEGNCHYEPMYVIDCDGERETTPVFALTDSVSKGGTITIKSLYNIGNGIDDVRPVLFPCGDSTGIVITFQYLIKGKWIDEYRVKDL